MISALPAQRNHLPPLGYYHGDEELLILARGPFRFPNVHEQ